LKGTSCLRDCTCGLWICKGHWSASDVVRLKMSLISLTSESPFLGRKYKIGARVKARVRAHTDAWMSPYVGSDLLEGKRAKRERQWCNRHNDRLHIARPLPEVYTLCYTLFSSNVSMRSFPRACQRIISNSDTKQQGQIKNHVV